MKRSALWAEIAALAVIAAVAWWLGERGAHAWLARVGSLDSVRAPSRDVVLAASRQASVFFVIAVAIVAASRWFGLRRSRDPIRVPWILPAAFAACALGLVFHQATVEVVRGVALAPSAPAFAQGILIGSILAACLLAVPVDLALIATRGRTILAIAIAAIFLALAVAGSGPAGSGTRINLGPIQPIEVVKLLVVVFLAVFLGARAGKLRWHRRRFLGLRWPRVELLVPAFVALVGIVAGLYVIGDLGPVLLLALIFLGMFYVVSGATGWAAGASALLGFVLVALYRWPALAGSGTVRTRLRMWSDPWTNGLPNAHQLGDGLWAHAAGGFDGQGLSQHAIPIAPAGKTDLALATLSEQLGSLGLLTYQLLIAAIVIGGLVVAARARTIERTLVAVGLSLLVLAQWIVIQAGTLGQLPLTGIVVPFVSSGRSSMVVFLVVVAVLVRVAADGRPRERSSELDDVQRGVRGIGVAMLVLAFASIVVGLVAYSGRHATSARTIAVRLADGTRLRRENPRLRAMADRMRRGTIADRNGAPLAASASDGTRSYPLGSALGTLLGVHPTSILLPPWSLERILEDRLRGYTDLAQFASLLDLPRSERERSIAALDANIASRSVRISIDAKLQTAVAKILASAHVRYAAAAVVLDVDTGHVLARVQVPDFDPTDAGWPTKARTGDRTFLGTYGAWPDKTGVHGMFQSGSVAKLFTALAAVRAGSATARFACVERDEQGPMFTRPGWPMPIHDHSGDSPHGEIDLVEALAVSCNVYFAQLGLALGPDPLVELRAAGVDIGFSERLEPGPAGSRQLGSSAFGQGVMVTSTMQAARLVAAIAAGGHYRRCAPTMEIDHACDDRVLLSDPGTMAPIVAGMRRVMTSGTGARLKPPDGIRVYGKTGTADVRGYRGEEPFGILPGKEAPPHSWFVAFAEPTSSEENAVDTKGRIAIAVVVPRGGTGASAAGPLAMQILSAAHDAGYFSR